MMENLERDYSIGLAPRRKNSRPRSSPELNQFRTTNQGAYKALVPTNEPPHTRFKDVKCRQVADLFGLFFGTFPSLQDRLTLGV